MENRHRGIYLHNSIASANYYLSETTRIEDAGYKPISSNSHMPTIRDKTEQES